MITRLNILFSCVYIPQGHYKEVYSLKSVVVF